MLLQLAFAVTLAVCIHGASIERPTIDQIIAAASENASPLESDGSIRVELDTLYTAEQWAEMMKNPDAAGQYKAIDGDRYRWTGNTIPYVFASGHFSSSQQNLIVSAMRTWESLVCIKFRPATSSDRNYIYIQGGNGCSSYVGMIGGGQRVTLGNGCVYSSVIIHELGHAIGFQHEHQRPDRASFITVYPQNASPTYKFAFDVIYGVNNYGIGYDYGSIMHYGEYAFSNNGQRTIITRDPNWQSRIGTAQTLSQADVQLARIIHKC